MLEPFLRTARRMPLERLHWLAEDLAKPLASVAYRRRMVLANLARAFPEANARALAAQFYAALGQVCVETLKAEAMEAKELRDRVALDGAEALRGGKAVVAMAHHGNLVWAACALALAAGAPVSVVYKTPHVARMRQMIVAIAERFGVDLVPVKEVRARLVHSRHEARIWTIVADQRPGRSRCHAPLCGRRTAFFTGPERIARALRWPVYYLSCRRAAPGRYRCAVDKIAEPPYREEPNGAVMERYAEKLQADIDHAPADWLWSHDRWRGE